MKIVAEVIKARRWRNTETGATASFYGAVPWHGTQGAWIVEEWGWTWRLTQGGIGLGRAPAKTEAEAIEIMKRVNGEV